MSEFVEEISYNSGSTRTVSTPACPSPHLVAGGDIGMADFHRTPFRPCSRSGCNEPSFGRSGNNAYCTKHRAFMQMKLNAKQRGKSVPSWDELEALLPVDMKCLACLRTMNWRRSDGGSTAITLQHDDSGAHRLICQGCNTKHSAVPNDGFYTLPDGHKHCPGCSTVKTLVSFAVDRSRVCGVKSRCRDCCRAFYEVNRSYWQRWGQQRRRKERD